MCNKTPTNLEMHYVDAIQDAFQVVQEEFETETDVRLRAQIQALRQCLADCRSYQQELEEDAAIDRYGSDLPDDIMPKEIRNAAA